MRYFIISFNYISMNGDNEFGNLEITSNLYPRHAFISSEIIRANPNTASFTIINIIEISQADYESYKSQSFKPLSK